MLWFLASSLALSLPSCVIASDCVFVPSSKVNKNSTFRCVEFLWTSGQGVEHWCRNVNFARYGYIDDNKINGEQPCSEEGNRTTCYCKEASSTCNHESFARSLFLSNADEVMKLCPRYESSFMYHNTGDEYWQRIVNADVKYSEDDKITIYEHRPDTGRTIRRAVYAYQHFNPLKQEQLYGSSSVVLQLICIFIFGYTLIIVIVNVLATKHAIFSKDG